MKKGYTTRQQIENYLLITIDSSFYDQIDSWIEQIEKHIDQVTGRNFVAGTASERVYDGDGSSTLLIDDATEVTKIEIDDVEVDDESGDEAQYLLYPANETPKTKIKLLYQTFTRDYQNIAITAKWGYSDETPADIMLAATVLVAGIINYAWNDDGEVKSMSVGQYSVTYKDEKQWQDFDRMMNVLQSYKKFKFV